MPRPALDPELKAQALAARKAGRSLREAAEVAGVTATTVARWEKEPAPSPPPIAPDVAARARALVAGAPEAPPEPADPMPDENDGLAVARWQRRQLLKAADRYEREGNMTAAQRARRDAANMSPVIARLEKARVEDGDALHFNRAEIDTAMMSVRERAAAIVSRPLLCAACSRALNVEIATGRDGER